MQKWRPRVEQKNNYVIPDIHGQYDCLSHLLKKILPLRKSEGILDHIVFLGDYIDRHVDSHKVIDLLIQVKEEYPDQAVFLKGNHEHMLLQSLGYEPCLFVQDTWDMWLFNGGRDTILGYLHRAKIFDLLPDTITPSKLKEIIPADHIQFMQSCQDYFWLDQQFLFAHGGLNPFIPLEKHEKEVFYWDRGLLKYVQNCIQKKEEVGWDYTIICGHSGPNPVVHPKFMMIDCGAPRRLLLMEANTREAVMAEPKKSRVVKFALENTESKKPSFTRVT